MASDGKDCPRAHVKMGSAPLRGYSLQFMTKGGHMVAAQALCMAMAHKTDDMPQGPKPVLRMCNENAQGEKYIYTH